MKRLLLVFPLLFALATSRVSADIVDDIITLAQKNLSTDVIIAFIDHHAEDLRDLKAADIARLMDAKVPDRVVEAVLRRQYAMPPDAASRAVAPEEPAPKEPETSQTEQTAPPLDSEDNVIYVVDSSYPVPIYYDVPMFAFGVDLFAFPHVHRHFDSFHHHHGDNFPFPQQPGHSSLGGHKTRPPRHEWTSTAPPVTQSPVPAPGKGKVVRPIIANTSPPHASTKLPAVENRLPPEHSAPALERITRAASHVPAVQVQPPVVHEARSPVGGYSGRSYSREPTDSGSSPSLRQGRR